MAAAQKVVLPLDRYLEVTEGQGVLRDEELPESHAPREGRQSIKPFS